MHKTNRRRFWIYDVNRAAIGDVDAECDAALVSDDAIARGEFAVWERSAAFEVRAERGPYLLDNCNFSTVHLFGREQWPTPKAGCVANFAMCGVKTLQHLGFMI
jgi:hypothetical protein